MLFWRYSVHANKFFVFILSVFLGLVHDDRIARRKIIVDRSSTTTIILYPSRFCNRLRAIFPPFLGHFRPCIIDKILSIFNGLLTGGFPEDMILLEPLIDQWRDDRLDILEVRIHYDIFRRDSLLRIQHKHLLKQRNQAFTACFQ